MKKTNTANSSNNVRDIRPALTPESEEKVCISLSIDLAKKQLMEGTASSQVITHFLKLGSSIAELEREKLALETELVKAKTKSITASEEASKSYKEAIEAMKKYSGHGDSDEDY